ncbi:MAG: sensor histidine kinase [Firmicutes bacterium HGW-Firmicutes-12]|jgi:signal transduction histidine kinase|nr:MAG: sensor histidine kinase [Firmicutes bacterium HGW-Firmicutes-12]
MTIRRQWLIVLILVAIFSVSINAFVLSSLTDRYFVDYMTENYEKHFSEIVEYSKIALSEKDFSLRQMAIELETHLDDPITRIKLYNAKGQLIVDVANESDMLGMMKNRGMFNRMMELQSEEVDHAEILDKDILVGQLNITRYSSVENSIAIRMFKAALLLNSLISIGIVLVFAVIIGIIVSRNMSKDMVQTAALAQNIEIGDYVSIKLSKIKEIRVVQQSLETLKAKLRLKNRSRKRLIDELIHQSRTPLTILKNHLESLEDGMIDMNSEEIKICDEQIDNITEIIANMSNMIDADKNEGRIEVEGFEFNQLLRQIVGGLRVQFNKKAINIDVLNHEKVTIYSDKYKLSQAIYNVLTNAYKYTSSEGKVTVKYEKQNKEMLIIIEDNGKGIKKEEQTKIFDAYYRSNNDNRTSGEGLGLFLAKENLQKIMGTIRVESELGKGSRFIIKIPLAI